MRIYLAESPIVEISALPLPPRLSSCCYHQLCPQLIRSGHLLHPLGRKGTSPNADSGQAEYCTTFTHVCVCLSPAHPGHLDQPDHSDHLDWSKKLSRNWIHLLCTVEHTNFDCETYLEMKQTNDFPPRPCTCHNVPKLQITLFPEDGRRNCRFEPIAKTF